MCMHIGLLCAIIGTVVIDKWIVTIGTGEQALRPNANVVSQSVERLTGHGS